MQIPLSKNYKILNYSKILKINYKYEKILLLCLLIIAITEYPASKATYLSTYQSNGFFSVSSNRVYNSGTVDGATIYFAGQIYNSFLTVQYRTEKLNTMNGGIIAGTLTAWTTVALNNTSTDGGKPY
ncbi:MAG: hypothetical protein U5M51_05860 [Emticicia sp.]|nr:hypothetical protein [Emticicia sp.]